MSNSKAVHYMPSYNSVYGYSACGLRCVERTNRKGKVTCKNCLRILGQSEEKKRKVGDFKKAALTFQPH